ncbi:MAG: serine acetyltransferase [Patiriisocius sp.]|jgi:serine acetyltransferase|tara:strand:- start:2590 stop:2730 length:141 start_codon:yes stop_codon:yes gene_type:complete
MLKISNFVELSAGCKLFGHIQIEEHAYIGSGAIIRSKLTIGKGAIV